MNNSHEFNYHDYISDRAKTHYAYQSLSPTALYYASTRHPDQALFYLIIRPLLHKTFRRTSSDISSSSRVQSSCAESGCREANSLLDFCKYYVMHMDWDEHST